MVQSTPPSIQMNTLTFNFVKGGSNHKVYPTLGSFLYIEQSAIAN